MSNTPDLPPLPEPTGFALVQGFGGTEDRLLSTTYDPDSARHSVNQMTAYAQAYAAPLLAQLEAARAREKDLRDDLQFVERMANHHGQKAHMTPLETLSCIQHYPPIVEITRSYVDGKVPETPNPWAALKKIAAKERHRGTVFLDVEDLIELDAALTQPEQPKDTK